MRRKKSALQHSLFRRYANFSKLMPTIHTSMASTFQCEHCRVLQSKYEIQVILKCTSHGGMYGEH